MARKKTLVLNSGVKIRITQKVFEVIMERMHEVIPEGKIIIRKEDDWKSPVIFVVKCGDISAIY